MAVFSVKEKRIVSYNPALAKKQKAEIMKMADKASNYTTYKKMTREELVQPHGHIRIGYGSAYLSEKEIKNFFQNCMLLDS